MGDTDQQNGEETASSSQMKSDEHKGKDGDKEKKRKAEAELRKKAELETKVRERVSLESKAFDVVNRLIESGITPEYLLKACAFIDHNHYEDIVEERSIVHLCGYPACSNQLSKVPKKKYHISTKTNTVYDITDRKRFCSNECYRSSHYLEAQIPRTPVWTRRNGDDFKFHLLQTNTSGSLEGEEVISKSKMSFLRQEVLQLEKMDQKTKVATKEALKESQKLSEELLSLSKEEDLLDTRMKNLSLSIKEEGQVGTVPGKMSGAAGGSCLSGARNEGKKNVSQNIDSASKVSAKESVGLESALGHLTLQEEAQRTSGSNDADNDGNGDTDKDSTHPKNSSTWPMDDKGTLDISKHHANSSKPGNDEKSIDFTEDSKQHTDSPSRSEETGTSSTSHNEINQKPSNPELRQQPGESKTAYLMRLLTKRQNLFSKVAAVQANASVDSQASETVKSTDVSAEAKENVNKGKSAKSFETQGGERQSDQTTEALSQNVQKRAEESVMSLESETSPTKGQDRQKKRPDSKLSPKQPKADTKRLQKASPKESPQAQLSPLNSVCQIVSQWVTPETLSYLGLNSVEGQGETESPSSDMFHKDPEMQRKYQELCQRLDHQEKDFDDIVGSEESLDGKENMSKRQPLPDYGELKKQTTEYSLRVKHFLTRPSASQIKNTKGDGGDGEDTNDSGRTVVLPAIDSHNQLLIRRRIVLERLSCVLPNLLPPLGLSVQDISGPLRELVFTFSLTSVNIVLKPAEWTLVSILVLQVLAKKSQAVVTALHSETRTRSLNMVLSHFGHSASSLEQLVNEALFEHRVE